MTLRAFPTNSVKSKKPSGKKSASVAASASTGFLQRLFQRKMKPRATPSSGGGGEAKAVGGSGKPAKRAPGVSGPDVTLAWTGSFRTSISLSRVEVGAATYAIEVTLQVRISDVAVLARQLPPGNEIYRSGEIGSWIAPQVEAVLRQAIRGKSYDQLRGPDISEIIDRELESLREHIAPLGLTSLGIVSVRIIDEKQEQLIKRDRTLDHREEDLQRTVRENEFLNRLAREDNRRTLDQAQTEAELDKALAEIDDQKQLTEAEREGIRRRIEFDRRIAAAKDARDLEQALGEAEKSRLFNDDELEDVRAEMERSDSDRSTTLELYQIENQRQIDRLQREILHERELDELEHAHTKALKATTNDLERRKLEDEYNDRRRQIDADFERQRAAEEDERAHAKKVRQMEVLREAETIREEREDRKHAREMESARLAREAEQNRLSAYQNMTADQIIAANPDIDPAAAQALAQFWSGKNASEQNDLIRELLEKKNDDMQRFMEKQMDLTRDLAGGGPRSGVARGDIEAFLSIVTDKMHGGSAGAGAKPKKGGPTGAPAADDPAACPSCGKAIPTDAAFCPYCGTRV